MPGAMDRVVAPVTLQVSVLLSPTKISVGVAVKLRDAPASPTTVIPPSPAAPPVSPASVPPVATGASPPPTGASPVPTGASLLPEPSVPPLSAVASTKPGEPESGTCVPPWSAGLTSG